MRRHFWSHVSHDCPLSTPWGLVGPAGPMGPMGPVGTMATPPFVATWSPSLRLFLEGEVNHKHIPTGEPQTPAPRQSRTQRKGPFKAHREYVWSIWVEMERWGWERQQWGTRASRPWANRPLGTLCEPLGLQKIWEFKTSGIHEPGKGGLST